MSDKTNARRTAIEVNFGGVNITKSMQQYLISLTFTDNEEDETDDLQIKLQDREGVWLEKWLDTAIQAAAGSASSKSVAAVTAKSSTTTTTAKTTDSNKYKVTSTSGLAVRSREGTQYYKYGTLAYGTVITVKSISAAGWANFTYSGKNAYVQAKYLQKVTSTTTTASTSSLSSSDTWKIGDAVIVTGTPQYSSYGTGTPGKKVTNYKGTVTHLNLKSGIPYPICVGVLGWFKTSEVKHYGTSSSSSSSSTSSTQTVTTNKGLRIQAVIVRQNWKGDGKDEVMDCGEFELDSVTASGPPAVITIKGTSLPYSSTVRQTLKSKSWENYKLSSIAQEIASKNNMACMFLSSNDIKYTRVEQYRQSDIVFLQKLCRDRGCSLKVSNNIIIIFDQGEYESKSSVMTIKKGSGYTKYKLSTGENNNYTSCHVSYTQPNGNTISARAYIADYKDDAEHNQCLEVRQKVSSIAEAKTLAEKMLRLYNKYEYMATFTFPGDPKLVAGKPVTLSGFGAFNGKYIIKQAKHTVSDSGYTTQITLRMSVVNKITTTSSSSSASSSSSSSSSTKTTTTTTTTFKVGDKVMLTSDAVIYGTTKRYASYVYGWVMYVREISGSRIVVSINQYGAITGAVDKKYLKKV